MIYIINLMLLFAVKVGNRFGRAVFFRVKMFSSERILKSNFAVNANFNFIQIGANDGISFDFLYDFVIQRKSCGVVVEPVLDYFKELEDNYRDFPEIVKISKAVHPIYKQALIYKIAAASVSKYPEWVKGIASFDSEHHKKLNIDTQDVLCITVEADNLMNIINDNFNHKKNDYFQVDTEGFDFEVLKMLDFNIIRPSMIKYEFVNLKTEDQKKSLVLLRSKGYYLFNELNDMVAIDLKKIKLY